MPVIGGLFLAVRVLTSSIRKILQIRIEAKISHVIFVDGHLFVLPWQILHRVPAAV